VVRAWHSPSPDPLRAKGRGHRGWVPFGGAGPLATATRCRHNAPIESRGVCRLTSSTGTARGASRGTLAAGTKYTMRGSLRPRRCLGKTRHLPTHRGVSPHTRVVKSSRCRLIWHITSFCGRARIGRFGTERDVKVPAHSIAVVFRFQLKQRQRNIGGAALL